MDDLRVGEGEIRLRNDGETTIHRMLPDGTRMARLEHFYGNDSLEIWESDKFIVRITLGSESRNYRITDVSRDSRYVLVRYNESTKFAVVDIVKEEVDEYLYLVNVADEIIFGPPGYLIRSDTSHRLEFLKYGPFDDLPHVRDYEVPGVTRIYGIMSNGKSQIFANAVDGPTRRKFLMISGVTNPVTRVLFNPDGAEMEYVPQGFEFVTPSVFVVKLEFKFYIYDLNKMDFIHRFKDTDRVLKRRFAISPDGKMMFSRKFGLNSGFLPDKKSEICITPLMITREILEGATKDDLEEKLVSSDDNGKLYVKDYRPTLPLVILSTDYAHATNDIVRASSHSLTLLAFDNRSKIDVKFSHPLNSPVYTQTSGFKWTRLMSNRTIETNATWPNSVPIADHAKLALSDTMKAAIGAWMHYPELAFDEALVEYREKMIRMAHMMTREVGLYY